MSEIVDPRANAAVVLLGKEVGMSMSEGRVVMERAAAFARGLGWQQVAEGRDGSGDRVGFVLQLPSIDGLSPVVKREQLVRILGVEGWVFVSETVAERALTVSFFRAV